MMSYLCPSQFWGAGSEFSDGPMSRLKSGPAGRTDPFRVEYLIGSDSEKKMDPKFVFVAQIKMLISPKIE